MQRPTDKVLRGLACIATAAQVSKEDPRFKLIPEKTQKDINAAIIWVRGMTRVKARRSVARAMMDENPGLYVKPPAYNPEWFTKKGYHIKGGCTHLTIRDFVLDEKADPKTWICTACRKQFQWSDESSYFGNIECPKCGWPSMKGVFCSKECRVRAAGRMPE